MVSKKSAQDGQIGQKITKNTKAIPRLAKKVLGSGKLVKKQPKYKGYPTAIPRLAKKVLETLKNDQNCPKVTKSVTFSIEPVRAGEIFDQLNKKPSNPQKTPRIWKASARGESRAFFPARFYCFGAFFGRFFGVFSAGCFLLNWWT